MCVYICSLCASFRNFIPFAIPSFTYSSQYAPFQFTHRAYSQSKGNANRPTGQSAYNVSTNRKKRKKPYTDIALWWSKSNICNTKKNDNIYINDITWTWARTETWKRTWMRQKVMEENSHNCWHTQKKKQPTDTKRVITAKLYRSRQFCIFKWRVLESSSIHSLISFFCLVHSGVIL